MFNCKACKAKDQQIEYLQKLTDSLLPLHGARPVIEVQDDEAEELTEQEKLFAKGAIIMGGD